MAQFKNQMYPKSLKHLLEIIAISIDEIEDFGYIDTLKKLYCCSKPGLAFHPKGLRIK